MKKDIKSTDKISKQTLHEILLDIKYRLDHLEDIEADNRDVIIKLVKQGNQIVKFLKQIEIEDVTDDYFEDITTPPVSKSEQVRSERVQHIKELVEEYMGKHKDLKEFEEELKKYRKEITPGTIGES